jgi:hypothetical protein
VGSEQLFSTVHVARVAEINVHRNLTEKLEGKRTFIRSRSRWEDSVILRKLIRGCGLESSGSG